LGDFKAFYGRYGLKIWLILIVATILVLTLGCLFLPEIFWEKFIYRYYWGPVEIDAKELDPIVQTDGYVIDQGYTLISEITYGIILILALFGIYRLLERFKIQIDLRFVLSVLPFFFLGGTLRVLEDAELFRDPHVFFFISPLIYFVIGALILGVILFAVFIERREKFPLKKKLILGGMMWLIFDLAYVIIFFFNEDGFNYLVHPFIPIFFSIVSFAILIHYSIKKNEFNWFFLVFLFGLFLLVFSLFIIFLWPSISEWKTAYFEAHGIFRVETKPLAGFAVILISVIITFCTFFIAKLLSKKHNIFYIYTNLINILIIFGQMLDATATFVGVDFYGYSEKHPIPDFFFQTFGTSAVFLPIKMILACLIVYLIDISFKDELSKYPILRGLIKIVIIVLGLAPGTRDMLRTMMGI